jgi:capsular exopolysaccharide synthesis family protein
LNNVSVAEQAAVPQEPVSPRTTLNMLLGLVLGLVLAGGLVGLLEYLDDTFKVAEDTQSALGLTPLGVVELIGGKRSRSKNKVKKGEPAAPVAGLVSMTNVNSSAAESYRLLRANLDFAGLDRPMRKLLITSALPQEGKSTTAANLAVVMAQSGKRVLLLDLDLRRPSQHKRFKLPNYIGLTSVLLGTAGLDEALQQVGIENLRVLTSGPLPPSPGDTLTSQAMEALLATLAQSFDVLIADSPPVLVASDAVAISPRMDGVLFVVAAESTSRRVAKNALETLRRTGSLLVGAVLNMQPQTGKQSYYYYNYKNYRATEGSTGPLGGEARLKQLGAPALASARHQGKQGR